jgi:hypothetical protein
MILKHESRGEKVIRELFNREHIRGFRPDCMTTRELIGALSNTEYALNVNEY